MSSETRFHNPELQAAFEKSQEHITSFRENLDAISADVKRLEEVLDSSGIRLTRAYRFHSEGIELEGTPDVTGRYSGSIARDEEWIEWGESDVKGRWRIMFYLLRRNGEVEFDEEMIDSGPTFNGPSEIVERRPLIEMPVEVRLRAYKALPALLKDIGATVAVSRKDVLDEILPLDESRRPCGEPS